VVVVVESADVAMTAREERFDDLAFGALERDMLKELPGSKGSELIDIVALI